MSEGKPKSRMSLWIGLAAVGIVIGLCLTIALVILLNRAAGVPGQVPF